MSTRPTVSIPVMRRLPRYYRFLAELRSNGIERISSKDLAARMQLTASQIRQDLNCFGGFGQQGYGYNISQLTSEIEKILFLDTKIPTILIGVGNLGRALSGYVAYEAKGVSLIGLFDKNPRDAMSITSDLEVQPITKLDNFCTEHHPELAILCIPGERAQQLAEKLVSLGIKGFWNFTHVDLRLPSNVTVENVHLGDSLMALGFMLNTELQNEKTSATL